MPPEDSQQFTPQNDPPEDINTDVPDSTPDASEPTVGSIAEPSKPMESSEPSEANDVAEKFEQTVNFSESPSSESTQTNENPDQVEQTVTSPESEVLNSDLGPEAPEIESLGPEEVPLTKTPPEPAMNIEPTIAPTVEVPESSPEPIHVPEVTEPPSDIEALSSTEPITDEPATPAVSYSLADHPPGPNVSEPATIEPSAAVSAQAATSLNTKPGGKKKVVKIVLLLVLVVVLVLGGLFAFMTISGMQAPKYSKLKEVSIEGYTGNDTGMKFSIPEEFKEISATSQSVTYYDYIKDDQEEKDKIHAEVAGGVESLFSGELSQDEVNKVLTELETTANDADALSGIIADDAFKNVKLDKFSKDEAAGSVRIDLTGEMNVEGETTTGKIAIKLIVSKSGYLYTFGISATDEIWSKNSAIFEEMFNKVQVDQDVPEAEESTE